MRKFFKFLKWTLISLSVMIIIIPASLYIPFVQNSICQFAIIYLNDHNEQLYFELDKIRIGYPLKIQVFGFKAFNKSDNSLYFSLGELTSSVDGIPFKERDSYDISTIKLSNAYLGLDSITESLYINGFFNNLSITDVSVDLNSSNVKLGDIYFDKPSFEISYTSIEDSTESLPFAWDIKADNFIMSQAKLGLKYGNLAYNLDSLYLSADILSYDSLQDINISNLKLHLPDSNMEGNIAANLQVFSLDGGFADVDIAANISKSDIVKFTSPFIETIKTNWPEEQTELNFDFYVTLDTIDINKILLKIPNHTDFIVSGSGIRPFSKYNRSIKFFAKGDLADADFLLSTFVNEHKDRNYQIPRNLYVDINGNFRKDYIDANYKFSANKIKVLDGNGNYQIDTEAYSVKAVAKDLVLSDFVPTTGIFSLSTHVSARGRHFVFPSRYTKLEASIQLDTLLYNNGKGERDSIFNLNLDASLDKSKYFASLTSDNPYILLDTQLEGVYDKKEVSAQGYIDLDNLDLIHLPQFVAFDLGKLSMQSDIAASYDYGDNLYADLFVHTLTYDDGTRINPIDEIDLHVESEANKMSGRLESGDAEFSFISDQSVASIIKPIEETTKEINRQLSNPELNLPEIQKLLPNVQSHLSFGRNNSLYPIVKLLGYRFNKIDAEIQNNESLKFNAQVIGLNFNNTRVDSLLLSLTPIKDNLVYQYDIHANYYAPKAIDSYDIKSSGEIFVDSITTCLQYENGKYIKMYDVDASLAFANDSLCLRFIEDPTIYAQKFEVNNDNFISVSNFIDLTKKELAINALLDLDGKNDLCLNIKTQKKETLAGNEVKLKLENLDLHYLSETLGLSLDINGNLNTIGHIDLLPDTLIANLNAAVSNFRIDDFSADKMNFVGSFAREKNNSSLDGRFTINDLVKLIIDASLSDSINIDVRADELPLPLLNAFIPTNFRFYGDASANVKVIGKDFEDSMINGSLSMHDAKLNFADCNADVHFPNDTIGIRRNRIRLRDYRLYAANKNPLNITGSVDFNKSLTDPELNLILKGNKIDLFNNDKRINKSQYICGNLPSNINMNVKGRVSNLNISGNVSALEGTNLTYYLEDDPLNSISKVDQLVEFVRFKELDRIINDDYVREYRVGKQEEGAKVDLKLDIAQNAKVNVKLPTSAEDHVLLIGGGQLQLNYNPDGSVLMSGLYDINGGDVYYKLPMLPVSKEFTLNDNSWISWNGNVDEPKINLIAKEIVKTNVNDNSGSRPVIFDVILNIAGTLNSLDLSFDCQAPEDGNISSELSSLTDEERAKQALLLLIAQTYMGPGSTSSAGLSSANAMLNSLINKELESLLTNKFKNTDIDFGIDTYNTDGASRTDYSIKVSQRLFNDRIRVSVGGKISSGEDAQAGQSDAKIDDVSLEYLTKVDGSSYLRLFRKTNYQNILEGEIIETGIGYVQQRSGFRFRSLLLPTSKKRKAEIQKMINDMQEKERQEDSYRRRKRTNADSTLNKTINEENVKYRQDSIKNSGLSVTASDSINY